MVSNLAIKSLIGLGIAGGISFTVYALIPSNRKNLITEKLIKNKYTVLTTETKSSAHWNSILNSYKSSNFKFDNFNGNESNALNRLQQICNELTKPALVSKDNLDDYKKAEKWCVEPITVSSILGKRGTKLLNLLETDKNKDKEKWEKIIKAHKKEPTKKITISDLSSGEDVQEDDITKFKAECKKIGDKKNHEDKYEENLKTFES